MPIVESGPGTASGAAAHVIVDSSALPTGAATEVTLADCEADLDAILAAQTDGTQKTQVTNFPATQPVSAVALPLPTGASTEATLAAIKAKTDNLDVALSTRAVTGLTDAQLRASAVPVSGAFFQATQPVSAVSLPLPTGAATEATLATRLADATFTGRVNTQGQKTMAASTPVVLASDQTVIPVSDNGGSLTVDSTQLPAALVGGRLDENVGAWLGSTAPTVGQKTGANSVPVVIASDDTVAVSAAALPLPAGAATSALQTTGNTSLASIDGKLPAALVGGRLDENVGAWLGSTAPTVGSKTSTNSVPVVIASDQGAVAISAAALPLPAGAATSALQTTGNTSLSNIDTNTAASKADLDTLVVRIPAQGQALMAASMPVAIASNQTAIPASVSGNVTVVGPTADGATSTAGPVAVAGVDANGVVQNLPILSRSVADEPRDTAVAVRSKRLEDALDLIAQQNQIIIQLLAQIAIQCDPTTPAALLQLTPPTSVLGDGTNAQIIDAFTPADQLSPIQ